MKKNNNFIEKIDINEGVVTFDDFDITDDISFEKQKYSYKEDMLQISFKDRLILDVGWRPEHDPKGYFITQVVQNYDWMNPLLKLKSVSLAQLKKTIEEAVALINEIGNK